MKFKLLLIPALLGCVPSLQAEEIDNQVEMTVYHSPTCSCCVKWLEHAKQNGFNVKDVVISDMQSVKEKYGIPQKLASCHTAVIKGYVIEGHVPAGDIQKLLQTKLKVAGIAAPGMPMGSPGMEMGGRKTEYQVISFDNNNGLQVFSKH